MWNDLFTLCLKKKEEKGDKIVLPVSALEALVQENVDYPLLFRLSGMGNPEKITHSGVLKFEAPEGTVLVPPWMANHLGMRSGDIVRVENASLPKATYAKFRILTESLWEVADMRAVLERGLRHHSCLTVGDIVVMDDYSLEVLQVRPEMLDRAVCIIETDCEVDFEERPPRATPIPSTIPAATRPPSRFSSSSLRRSTLFPGPGNSLG